MVLFPFFMVEVIVDLRFKAVVRLEILFEFEMKFVVVGLKVGLMR